MISNIKDRIKEFSEIIERNPYEKELYIERAKLYAENKEYKKAFEDFKKTLSGCYICKDIMTVCTELKLNNEIERIYTKAINKDKNNVGNYIDRIYFYMNIGEIKKAIFDCKTVLNICPKEETILILHKILTKKSY